MARTTAIAVGKLIEVDVGDDLTPFIDSAAVVVDEIAALPNASSLIEQELVERWLAAHFYGVFQQRPASEKAGPVAESKQFWVGYGFQTTMHGSQAMLLDSTGHLVELNSKAKADVKDLRKRKGAVHFLGKSSTN